MSPKDEEMDDMRTRLTKAKMMIKKMKVEFMENLKMPKKAYTEKEPPTESHKQETSYRTCSSRESLLK